MKVNAYDLSKTLKKYSNEWIALDPNKMKVISVGKLPKNVLEESRKKGILHPVITRAPKDYGAYIL
ncbi:MAG: hypothetical protein COU25_01405 [Candidatus Levybacteria bacterium CG10_big_fil_rev_8_21_14_0_10_35_13]|nr:MAG: hypothetical protein COU25_01405 [Candidatus Levybacteria bacterium CG10_big_fil_rev_8_21_14_0_10_35_13]